ncbi:MAG: anti-sigma factor [Shinella sp.]|nr:anti-sigma factor [Shinella sp.]
METIDQIVESDLHAYVDDQLDVSRRIEVEAFLSENPAIAAKVMADLRVKGELRLALADQPRIYGQEARHAARRLEQALYRRRYLVMFRKAAAIAMFVTAGWIAHVQFGPFGATEVVASVPAPGFVQEAIKAHQTTMLRERMASQHEAADYDPDEIRSATAIMMPEIPKDWSVLDVQIFPSAFGPSVEMAVVPGKGEQMSLFAVRPGNFTVQHVLSLDQESTRAAYWQIGDVAYALVSDSKKPDELSDTAKRLAQTLY